MKPHEQHRHAASKEVKLAVVTISTSKYRETQEGKTRVSDLSGETIRSFAEQAGYTIVSQELIDDDIGMIRLTVLKNIYEAGADAVILTGGTGITGRDVTIEALRPLFEKELEGFGDAAIRVAIKEPDEAEVFGRQRDGVFLLGDCRTLARELYVSEAILDEIREFVIHIVSIACRD